MEKETVVKRKPSVDLITGQNETKPMSIADCIDFTIQNVGTEIIYFGFRKDGIPDQPLNPGEFSNWPLYRPCEEWDGEIYIKFGAAGSIAALKKTLSR